MRNFGTHLLTALLFLLALSISGYALAYVILGEQMYPDQFMASFLARPWGIYPHAFFGAIALAIGPLQFQRGILRRRRGFHRMTGKAYVIAALVTALAGFYMAAYAFGGWVTWVGFSLLAVFTFAATLKAYSLIKNRQVAHHREWMLRSYALIFAAVTLRIELPLLEALTGGFEPAYLIVSWLCWVPNLLFIEGYIRWSRDRSSVSVQELHPVAA